MAIGDTLRPELIRSDTSGILQGGLAAGRSAERGLSEFGKAIAMGKRELDAKKQKRRDDEEAAQAILRMDASIGLDEARALAKHSAVRDFRDRLAAEEARDQAMALQRMQMDAMEDAARRLEEQEAGQKAAYDWLLQPQGGEVTEVVEPGKTVGEVAEGFLGGVPVELSPSDKQAVEEAIRRSGGSLGSPWGGANPATALNDVIEEWNRIQGTEKGRLAGRAHEQELLGVKLALAKEPLVRAYAQELMGVKPTPSPTAGRPWLSEAFAKAGEAIGGVRLPDRIRREVAPSFVPAEAKSPTEFLRMLGESDLDPQAKQNLYGEFIRREASDFEKQKNAAQLALSLGTARRAETAEERAQNEEGRKAREEARELSVLGFDGLKVRGFPISGQIPDRVTALKTKEELSNFNDLIGKVEELQRFADQREEEWWMDTDDKLAAENLARQIQALMRVEVLGPGTVQQAEREILEKMAGDPTKFWSIKKGATGKHLLETMKEGLINKFKNKLQTLGLKVGKGTGGSSAGGSSSWALPSGISGLEIEEL